MRGVGATWLRRGKESVKRLIKLQNYLSFSPILFSLYFVWIEEIKEKGKEKKFNSLNFFI